MWTRTTTSASPVAIVIFWLAIVGNNIALSASADVEPEDIQDSVVPATTPPRVGNNNNNNAAPAAGGVEAYTHVHIVNEFTGGRALTVHCRSKNEDMGVRVVPPRFEYLWRFRPSILGDTLFWCHVAKGNVEIEYEAYYNYDDKMWQRVYMDNTYWIAKDDGLYLRQFWKNNNEVFWRRWP